MMRTYGAQPIAVSFLSRSYHQTKKPARESWRASKQFVAATASFMASGLYLVKRLTYSAQNDKLEKSTFVFFINFCYPFWFSSSVHWTDVENL
jgi:hypothetical protein